MVKETQMKQTEIGWIPEDWAITTLSNAVDFMDGMRRPIKSSERKSGEFPYYGASGIIDYVENFIFDDELILLGEDGENILSRNLPLAFIVKGKIWVNNHAHVLKPKTGFHIRFLSEYLESLDYSLLNSGTAQPKLNKQSCLNIKIVVPPLAEQEAIAAALSDCDAWIESLEAVIAKKRLIKQGAMQELLIPKEDWEVKKLWELTKIYTGKKNNQDKIENGIFPFFVRSQNIERINSYSYDGEAILVPGEGNLGSIFHYINGKFDFHQRVYKVSDFSGIDGKFTFWYFRMYFGQHAMQNTVKATVDSIRLPTLQEFEIRFPKSLSEQTRIATVLSDMDAELEALGQKLNKARQIKQGMMQELLTGRVRLG